MYQVPKRMWRNESSASASVGYSALQHPLPVDPRDKLTQLRAVGA